MVGGVVLDDEFEKGIEELAKDEGEWVLMVALWKVVKVAADMVRGFKEG